MIIDVQPKELGIPTKDYYDVEEVKEVWTIRMSLLCVCVCSQRGLTVEADRHPFGC